MKLGLRYKSSHSQGYFSQHNRVAMEARRYQYTRVPISSQPDLLSVVFCLMVRTFRFFVEDLKTSIMLPMTTAYKDALRKLNNKKDIWKDFYTTEAMTNRKWTETNYQLRHVINRIAVHGFHFKFCSEARVHENSDECRCKLCSAPRDRYHIIQCTARRRSMTEQATE